MRDVVILGGGPAGMACALPVARARLDVLVVNEERPRNQVTHASHGLYTRDGAHPDELLAVSKEQLLRYPTARYHKGRATGVRRIEGGFEVELDGTWQATRRLVLTTGFRSVFDGVGIEGIGELYGRSVFPCPFCDGFELADRTLAVFAGGMPAPMVVHYLVMIRTLSSSDLRLFTHGDPVDAELAEQLEARGIPYFTERIARLQADGTQLTGVVLEDGRTIPVGAGFLGTPHAEPSDSFAAVLGAELGEHPFGWPVVVTGERGETTVDGLFAAGDLGNGFAGLAGAVGSGWLAGAGVVAAFAAERWHG